LGFSGVEETLMKCIFTESSFDLFNRRGVWYSAGSSDHDEVLQILQKWPLLFHVSVIFLMPQPNGAISVTVREMSRIPHYLEIGSQRAVRLLALRSGRALSHIFVVLMLEAE
jgi:hypothetical protein